MSFHTRKLEWLNLEPLKFVRWSLSRVHPPRTPMPASTKFPWIDLLTAARSVRTRTGIRPTTNAVAKAAGGGDPRRIQLAITAVEIDHGHHVHLIDTLPAELRALVTDPRRGGVPPENPADTDLPDGVREGLAQVAASCTVALQRAYATAELRLADAEASVTASVEDMHSRLLDQEQEAEVKRREPAEITADYERRVGELSTAVATSEQEIASRIRELDGAHADLERAQEAEREARAQRDRTVEAHHALAERAAADLAAAVAQAVRAEAERDAVQQLAARFGTELQAARADQEATITRLSAEIDSLRGELTAARHAQHDAAAARAASEARLAEVRTERDRLVAVGGR